MNAGANAKCLKEDQYDIYVKNTFLVFEVESPCEGGERLQLTRRAASCPPKCESTNPVTDDSHVEKNVVETTASTMASLDPWSDGDSSRSRRSSEDLEAASAGAHSPAGDEQLELHRKINRQLSSGSTPAKILFVVERNLTVMNGINLSTAFHRLGRCSQELHQRQVKVLSTMVELAQKKALQELQCHDGTLPANCCTIIAWSCAMLKVFPRPLFSALIAVVAQSGTTCDVYEVSNLLWACVQYQKAARRELRELDRSGSTGGKSSPFVAESYDAIAFLVRGYFAHRPFEGIKTSILLSAFTSVAALLPNSHQKRLLLKDLRDTLRRRLSELSEPQRKLVFGPKRIAQ
eukprot:s60_g7.t1